MQKHSSIERSSHAGVVGVRSLQPLKAAKARESCLRSRLYRMGQKLEKPRFDGDPQSCVCDPRVVVKPLRSLTHEPVVEGSMRSTGGNSFSINLETSNGDIAIHINPRFSQTQTVVNSLQNGVWRSEKLYPIPISHGARFTFKIEAYGLMYSVYINSTCFAAYMSHADCATVMALTLYGDATLDEVHQHGDSFPINHKHPLDDTKTPLPRYVD
ncbi:32 kDa beta-galactoside-binding lectin-like [Ornithodoros turicata]|uniref:32 kDa beta-galactoside-binding lectin-like n=1 Tax=Ornithodoros turicata TaxID=34597 RepID=UPI003138BB72